MRAVKENVSVTCGHMETRDQERMENPIIQNQNVSKTFQTKEGQIDALKDMQKRGLI